MLKSREAFEAMRSGNVIPGKHNVSAVQAEAIVEIAEALTNMADLLLEARNESREGG